MAWYRANREVVHVGATEHRDRMNELGMHQ
jgi:hypothetical protein